MSQQQLQIQRKPCAKCGEVHTACTAHKKKKNGGGPCGAPPMPNGTCAVHGGKSLNSIAHPNHKTGIHSRYRFANGNLARLYEDAALDPAPLEFLEDIRLFQARINELIEAESTGSPELWKEAWEAFQQFNEARMHKDEDGFKRGLIRLHNALSLGGESARRWKEITDLTLKKKSLQEAEIKRLVLAHQVVTVEALMGMLAELAALVKANVTDRTARANIAAGFSRISGAPVSE